MWCFLTCLGYITLWDRLPQAEYSFPVSFLPAPWSKRELQGWEEERPWKRGCTNAKASAKSAILYTILGWRVVARRDKEVQSMLYSSSNNYFLHNLVQEADITKISQWDCFISNPVLDWPEFLISSSIIKPYF